MAVTKIKTIKSTLSKALDYIQTPDKTDGKS
ncbi:relaxase, partial [[Ruminococcus] torques]|nr:relaxase [[Ruminococcus] torques]